MIKLIGNRSKIKLLNKLLLTNLNVISEITIINIPIRNMANLNLR